MGDADVRKRCMRYVLLPSHGTNMSDGFCMSLGVRVIHAVSGKPKQLHMVIRFVRPVLASLGHKRFFARQSRIQNCLQRMCIYASYLVSRRGQSIQNREIDQQRDDGGHEQLARGQERPQSADGVYVRTVERESNFLPCFSILPRWTIQFGVIRGVDA